MERDGKKRQMFLQKKRWYRPAIIKFSPSLGKITLVITRPETNMAPQK